MMTLSKKTTEFLSHLVQTTLECDDSIDKYTIEPELKQLITYLNVPSLRSTIAIEGMIIIPETKDLILNVLVNHYFETLNNDIDTTDVENAIWNYMIETHGFELENHDLLKHTFEEAITYAIDFASLEL